MSDGAARRASSTRRVSLLAGQAFALGLLMSWILIPASAVFLATYGADLLPFTYIGAALAGIVSSAALSASLRRRPLATVALRLLIGTSTVLVLAWLSLSNGVRWLSFGLLVLVPIVVPMGFMLLVGQAGMLLDVRALKSLYARVIAGFAFGFVAGGLGAPPLIDLVGRAEHLVLGAAVAGALWVALLARTRHEFRDELSGVEQHDPVAPADAPTWRSLLRRRDVTLIVAFQMLSAVESQWLDYLVYERAAGRYQDSHELARFISRFTAIAYGADIVFLLLIAGFLLRRIGLRYGLTANPGVVLALVIGVVTLSAAQGSGATLVFVLIVSARIADLVLADGAARTSLSAAYQVVPTSLRLAAQAGVEGLAVPLAIGVSGVVLLALQATVGTGGAVLPVLVAAVVAIWLLVAVLVHRSYRLGLLTSLRFRTLDPATLSIDDANGLAVADRLLDSDDTRDVRVGLDTLTQAAHPALADRLVQLTQDARGVVRTDALERLSRLDEELAAIAARQALDDPAPSVRACSVRVLAAAGDPTDLPAIYEHRSDDDHDVRVAVLVAIAHLGDADGRAAVTTEVATRAASPARADRLLAAAVLAASDAPIDRAPLAALVMDPDPEIAVVALDATSPDDPTVLPAMIRRLGDRATAGAAVHTLVRAGEPVLASAAAVLEGGTDDRRVMELVVRVVREVGGPRAIDVLVDHIEHPDREVGLAVLVALGPLLGAAARDGADHRPVDASLVVLADLEHATRTLRAVVACDPHPAAHTLRDALRDELVVLRRRVVAGLAARHGDEPIERVSFQLANGDGRSHALALEWLDVTLTGTDRAALPLLEPGLSESERLRRLRRSLPLPECSLEQVLRDLIADPERRWREPWVRACAVHTAWSLTELGPDLAGLAADLQTEHVGGDPSIVVETLEAIRARADGPTRICAQRR